MSQAESLCTRHQQTSCWCAITFPTTHHIETMAGRMDSLSMAAFTSLRNTSRWPAAKGDSRSNSSGLWIASETRSNGTCTAVNSIANSNHLIENNSEVYYWSNQIIKCLFQGTHEGTPSAVTLSRHLITHRDLAEKEWRMKQEALTGPHLYLWLRSSSIHHTSHCQPRPFSRRTIIHRFAACSNGSAAFQTTDLRTL